ncbi:MAG: hypothetical protein HQ578_02210, partial [Chloroflexi bacterium]|nr:hypothetical protein [Chloroflexota bacterium]
GWVFLQQVEEGRLFIIAAVALADGLDDGAGINVLMDTERDCEDIQRRYALLYQPKQAVGQGAGAYATKHQQPMESVLTPGGGRPWARKNLVITDAKGGFIRYVLYQNGRRSVLR